MCSRLRWSPPCWGVANDWDELFLDEAIELMTLEIHAAEGQNDGKKVVTLTQNEKKGV